MRFNNHILLIYSVFVVSCSSVDIVFPREETITQEIMPLQGITCPFRVEVRHPFLFVENRKRTDSLFHIYDLTNYELKNAFGIKGDGPDDFVLSWLYNTQLQDILIADNSKNMLFRYSIDEEGQAVFQDVKKPSYISGVIDAAFINDSLYVVDAMYLAPCLYLLSLQDDLPRKSRQYRNPAIRDYYIDPNMGNVFANESRIAFCYGYRKQIDFMDTDLNLIKSVKFKYDSPKNIQGLGDKISYAYGYFGKRYLYVLFFGTTWREQRETTFRNTFLEVFDLDGNPVIRYRLDGIGPAYFAVDEETFTLYGAGEDGYPEDCLLVYKLKGLT